MLDQWVKDGQYSGINAAIARRGRVVWSGSFGFQDLESRAPMTPETIFRFFSMTKPIASAAAMMLYEEGKFLLDDPLANYIPGFDKVKVLATEDGDGSAVVDLERPLTVHHILTHTSGLNNGKAYQAQRIFDRQGTLADMARKVVTVPLSHQPGKAWRYGSSIDVVGYLVEVLSGKTFDVFLQERIFQPLGMPDTAFWVPKNKASRLAGSYQLNAAGKLEPSRRLGDPTAKPAFFSGSGGLYSTQADYLRFCQMLLNGGELDGKRLLSPRTVDYMMQNHVPPGVMPPQGPNGRTGYGFGIGGAVLVDPVAYETLASKGEYSWGGAAGTYFWVDRKEDLTAVFLIQRPPFAHPPTKKFKVMVYQALVA